MLYVNTFPGHAFEVPVIVPGVVGALRVTVYDRAALVPQPFEAVTVINPLAAVKPELKVTWIALVPAPAVIEAPVGTTQLYVAVFATATTE